MRQFLALPFSQTGVGGSTLAAGDSSGGVFINDGGVWKLAGINYGVDGNYSQTANGSYFGGAVFDKRGLYEGTSSDNFFWANSGPSISSDSYATRVSSRFAFIQSATQGQVVPEPGAWLLMAVGVGALALAQRVRNLRERAAA